MGHNEFVYACDRGEDNPRDMRVGEVFVRPVVSFRVESTVQELASAVSFSRPENWRRNRNGISNPETRPPEAATVSHGESPGD